MVGKRIKRARVHRGLTQKELGMMVGFNEKSADVRIAQYESSTRTPKADMRNKLAEALNINGSYLLDAHGCTVENIMFLLFELDEHCGLELTTADVGGPDKISIHIANQQMDEHLAAWIAQKNALAAGEISAPDYAEWMLTWPDSANIELARRMDKKNLRRQVITVSSTPPPSAAKKSFWGKATKRIMGAVGIGPARDTEYVK